MSSRVCKRGWYWQKMSTISSFWKCSCGTRAFTLRPSSFSASLGSRKKRTVTYRHCGEFIRLCSNHSSEVTVQEQMRSLIERPVLPKISRQPFVKDLFLGKFDKDVLAFPEVLDNNYINNINRIAQNARDVVNNTQLPPSNEEVISPLTIRSFKDLGYFGLEIPLQYDGCGMIATEVVRMAEAWGVDLNLALTLNTHHAVALQAVLKRGNDYLKNKYMRDFATGQKIAGFCLAEASSGSDVSMIESTLLPVDDEEGKYVLNGTKTWVTNGGIADVFLVFANIPLQTARGETEPHLTAVVVDREKPGLTVEPIGKTLGIQGLNISTVRLKDVPISQEDVIGEFGDGLKVASDILFYNRLALGGNVTGMLKEISKTVTEHLINKKSFDKQLMDHEIVRLRLSRMVCKTYAIESMAYLTAGLLDSTIDPDLQLEAAILKVYSSQGLWECINEALQLLGADAYRQGNMERWLRDARALPLVYGTDEILRQFVGLIGCSHAGDRLADDIKKLRNPLFNPVHVLKKKWMYIQVASENVKLNMDLRGYLHHSLTVPANWMEYCVKKFAYVVEMVLSRHGAKTDIAQIDLDRLAGIALEIYCMAAVLSRASRSYCIGLRNESHERLVATSICYASHNKVKQLVNDIETGPFLNCDVNHDMAAQVTCRDKGYSLVSPITRNW